MDSIKKKPPRQRRNTLLVNALLKNNVQNSASSLIEPPPNARVINRNQKEWEDYNQTFNTRLDSYVNYIAEDGYRYSASSYTHLFFEKLSLFSYLDQANPRMLQLGVSSGFFLSEYKNKNWEVCGYDFSEAAIRSCERHRVKARQIDLNNVSQLNAQPTLAYESQLLADISQPSHILLLRTLEYLNDDALLLLLTTLINHAKSGSAFFIGSNVAANDTLGKTANAHTPNFNLSLFAVRTDMEIMLSARVNYSDQVHVIRKL